MVNKKGVWRLLILKKDKVRASIYNMSPILFCPRKKRIMP